MKISFQVPLKNENLDCVMTQPDSRIRLVLHDKRQGSSSIGKTDVIELGRA